MVENDIYDSKRIYERFKEGLDGFIVRSSKAKYYCKNPINIGIPKKA